MCAGSDRLSGLAVKLLIVGAARGGAGDRRRRARVGRPGRPAAGSTAGRRRPRRPHRSRHLGVPDADSVPEFMQEHGFGVVDARIDWGVPIPVRVHGDVCLGRAVTRAGPGHCQGVAALEVHPGHVVLAVECLRSGRLAHERGQTVGGAWALRDRETRNGVRQRAETVEECLLAPRRLVGWVVVEDGLDAGSEARIVIPIDGSGQAVLGRSERPGALLRKHGGRDVARLLVRTNNRQDAHEDRLAFHARDAADRDGPRANLRLGAMIAEPKRAKPNVNPTASRRRGPKREGFISGISRLLPSLAPRATVGARCRDPSRRHVSDSS